MNKNLETGKEEIVAKYLKNNKTSQATALEKEKTRLAQMYLDDVIQKLADQNVISLENSRKLKAGSAYFKATTFYFDSLTKGGETARKNIDNESAKVHKSEEKTIKTYLKDKKKAEKRLGERAKHIAKQYKYKKDYGHTIEDHLIKASDKYQDILDNVVTFLKTRQSKELHGKEMREVVFGYLKNKIEVAQGKVNL